jgi:hypothetical protein
VVLELGHLGDQIRNRHLEIFETCLWGRIEIRWTDSVKNEEVLCKIKEERNILHTIKRKKANWIAHILRRNYLLMHVVEGKIDGRMEVAGRRSKRRKQLLDYFRETRGYWKLKEEALDGTVWRTHCGSGYEPVIRQAMG